MGEPIQVLLTSDSNGSRWSCSAWDPKTGTNLMVYKGGGTASSHGLSLLDNKFIVTANATKPLIHLWPVNSQEQVPGVRFVAPGKVNCLTISSDGAFLVAGVQESIYIWEICSGKMLQVLSKHYQAISKVQFVDDGSHFISSGRDGAVLVWNLTTAVSKEDDSQQPLYSFNDHALPVSDVFVGSGGMRAFMCSVSADRTCRIYDLASGSMLLTLVFTEPLTCVTVDALETQVFVGSSEGPIYLFKIHSPPRMKEYHMTNVDKKSQFLGHRGGVTCLALSMAGDILASGGQDDCVSLWHIKSKQILRTLAHTGAITNVSFFLTMRSAFNPDVRLNVVASSLSRMMDKSSNEPHIVEVLVSNRIEYGDESKEILASCSSAEGSQEVEDLRSEVQRLKKINKELFEYSVKNVLNNK